MDTNVYGIFDCVLMEPYFQRTNFVKKSNFI